MGKTSLHMSRDCWVDIGYRGGIASGWHRGVGRQDSTGWEWCQRRDQRSDPSVRVTDDGGGSAVAVTRGRCSRRGVRQHISELMEECVKSRPKREAVGRLSSRRLLLGSQVPALLSTPALSLISSDVWQAEVPLAQRDFSHLSPHAASAFPRPVFGRAARVTITPSQHAQRSLTSPTVGEVSVAVPPGGSEAQGEGT